MGATLYFDLIDPVSYLVDLELTAAEEEVGVRAGRIGVELRPPPAVLADSEDEVWAARWSTARRIAEGSGILLEQPPLIPWSRKALELLRHAGETERADATRTKIFEAFFVEGRDIGRVDVLVDLAAELGFDRTEAKAVLDVDRYRDEVIEHAWRAGQAGVEVIPSLRHGKTALEGFQNRGRLGTFLLDAT